MDMQLKSADTDRSLLLPDGRRLGYADHGAPDGRPLLFFHGAPNSRYQLDAAMVLTAKHRGVRLIAPERPGYGLSDPQPGRRLQDWATDVAALTDALGIARFPIIGFSNGCLYALACARQMPQRVDRLALCGSPAPLDTPNIIQDLAPQISGLYALARSDPDNLRAALAPWAESPAGLLSDMAAFMPDSDKKVFLQRATVFEVDMSEALRHGVDGAVSDFVLAANPWGFSPAEIETEVHLWQGSQDRTAPPAMAAYLASTLQKQKLFLLPQDGHLAMFTHWDEILKELFAS